VGPSCEIGLGSPPFIAGIKSPLDKEKRGKIQGGRRKPFTGIVLEGALLGKETEKV